MSKCRRVDGKRWKGECENGRRHAQAQVAAECRRVGKTCLESYSQPRLDKIKVTEVKKIRNAFFRRGPFNVATYPGIDIVYKPRHNIEGAGAQQSQVDFFYSSLSALKHVPETLCVTTSMARSAAQTEPWTCSPIPPKATRIVDLCHINFVEHGLLICLVLKVQAKRGEGMHWQR